MNTQTIFNLQTNQNRSNEMIENFGKIKHNGKTIILDEQAVQTSRLMNEYGNDLQYQGDGETYMDEWAACGHTESGEQVRVYWHFEIAREDVEKEGAYPNNTEAEDYDWDDVYSVRNDE